MKEKYLAAFIIPSGAKKLLGDGGWEFENSKRLPVDIKSHLVRSLKLSFLEDYLGVESYVNNSMKMSVLFDDQNEIESIHFQLNGDSFITLIEVCQGVEMPSDAELFIPIWAKN